MPPSSQTVSPIALATIDGTPVEKINAAEMGAHAFEHRRGKKGKGRNRNRSADAKANGRKEPENLGKPTPERLAKGDGTAKTAAGSYRAPPPIERLRDRNMLDPTLGYVNEAMYQAAVRFEELFYASGLSGSVAAQDLSRIVVHGGESAARYMPTGERQAYCRQKWREAVRIMGWHEAFPHRGAARLVIDVLCYGLGVKEAAAVHCPGGGSELQAGRGMDRLREGLFALAVLWRMC